MEQLSTTLGQGQRLKQACNLTGHSLRRFCHQQRLSYYTLQAVKLGRLPLSDKIARRLCQALQREHIHCTIEWLTRGQGLPPSHLLPTQNYSVDNQAKLISQDDCIAQEVDFFNKLHPQNIVLSITDDAMLPLYHLSDYVGGQRYESMQAPECSGLNCIIELVTGQKLVRHFTCSKKGVYHLSALNPHTTVDSPVLIITDIQSVAPILWHRRNLIIKSISNAVISDSDTA